jgi:hypothetical protein
MGAQKKYKGGLGEIEASGGRINLISN